MMEQAEIRRLPIIGWIISPPFGAAALALG
jgi:hypothetical protein